ncbi:putative disease resistance protein RGA1, partial [Bienertia sinuspersici]
MDVGTALSVAQTLYSALKSKELQEVLSIFDYKTQLDELQKTVKTIKAVLRDAEAKQELSHEAQNWIEELKNAVFEADDLFDEFVTLAEQKQLLKADGSLSKKVSSFFSRTQNPLNVAFRMSRGIKDVRKKLDAIAYNSQFSFKLDNEPIRKRRPETCSYVNEVDIIGREDDLDSIVGKLLDPNVQRDVSFLPIVGIGGLGKTALAQLVYNDPRVMKAFSLRLWTCVADQDQEQLDVKDIVCKILGLNKEVVTMDHVQSNLREKLASNKFLLVLDDVWTEKHEQWRALASLLMGGRGGSWVMVTTRSQETSRIIGNDQMHLLQGLSNENSWLLFKNIAFGTEQLDFPIDLVKIGKDIIEGCARVPLAIRVVGSLLYGQSKMFPKDFVIQKNMLIRMWMAQGYIIPLDEGQSIEDASEEYFSILSRRCFFQDFKTNKYGKSTCKIHDLMHDIAIKVSGKEISSTKTIGNNLDKKVRHLCLYRYREAEGQHSFPKTHIRSLIILYDTCMQNVYMNQIMVKQLVANCRWLRALHLTNSSITSLPESIGQLLHLRYLDLTGNIGLKLLPKSVTKLFNLQALELRYCLGLKELPKDLSKLVKLRSLGIESCFLLNCMPRGMGRLNCLQRLSDFIVGGEGSYSSWKQWFHELDELKALNKLKGSIKVHIRWPNVAKDVDKEREKREGSYLRDKEHLNHIEFRFMNVDGIIDDDGKIMKFMEELEPHSNLNWLKLNGYPIANMPRWVTSMEKIVHLFLKSCERVENLSVLGNLSHLKTLELVRLIKLEYIEEDNVDEQFLPALEILTLICMPKLKGWGRGASLDINSNNKQMQLQVYFPQLKRLIVQECQQLTCILMCPRVEVLKLTDFNQHLQIIINTERNGKLGEVSNLVEIKVSNVAWLNSLSFEAYHCLQSMNITQDEEVESLGEIEDVFLNCSSSLRILKVSNCSNLRRVMYGGLEHLSALEELEIENCDNLRLLEEVKKGNGIGISNILPSLHTLTLTNLLQLQTLPDWMQYLSRLQILKCQGLESMPNWMPKLTSLRKLELLDCSESLRKRYQKDPLGE